MQSLFGEDPRIRKIYQRIRAAEQQEGWMKPALSHYVNQPFKALIAALLSTRTREEDNLRATRALFALADDAASMAQLPDEAIQAAIEPVTYHERKTHYVKATARRVAANGGAVPKTVDALTAYPGVGWKVAVLTLEVGHDIHDDITVDVHVARIGKRLGLVKPDTKLPQKINDQLKHILPPDLWRHWNWLMVQFGREVCGGEPRCPRCPVNDLCPKIGVQP